MKTQLEAHNIVPKEFLGYLETAEVSSFTEALEILEHDDSENKALAFNGPISLNEDEERLLKLLPRVFGMNTNTTMKRLNFDSIEVDDILVAEALRSGMRKPTMTCISFWTCTKVGNQRLMETMCEGLHQRSTEFQLFLGLCSPEFAKPLIEASYLKCFSLGISVMEIQENASSMGAADIQHSLKKLFFKGNLYYISLKDMKGFKEDIFLQLGRCLLPSLYYISLTYMTRVKDDVFLQLGKCLLPKLVKLNLNGTEIPISALISLHGSLTKILESGRSNMFEILNLGSSELDIKTSYAFFKLLGSDLVREFYLTIKKDISRAAVKHISSTVANTKNLEVLEIQDSFSSGTKFSSFNLQEERRYFDSPFGVNPTAG